MITTRFWMFWMMGMICIMTLMSMSEALPITAPYLFDCAFPNITRSQEFGFETTYGIFTLNGLEMIGETKNPETGARYGDGVKFKIDTLVEVSTLVIPGNYHTCQAKPSVEFFRNATPYSRYGGNVVQVVNISDPALGMKCSMTRSVETLHTGQLLDLTTVKATWPDYPDFSAVFSFAILRDGERYSIKHFAGRPSTFGHDLDYYYHPGAVKLSALVTGYPWQVADIPTFQSNKSIIAIWTEAEAIFGPASDSGFGIEIKTSPTRFSLKFVSRRETGLQSVILDLETSAVLDGDPFIFTTEADNAGTQPVSLEFIQAVRRIPIIWEICNQDAGLLGEHYNELFYDPTLSILFSPDPTAPTAGGLTAFQRGMVALGICLAVVAIVIILLVIYLTVPSFKLAVRPYLARKRLNHVPTQQSEPENSSPDSKPRTWSKASKPTALNP